MVTDLRMIWNDVFLDGRGLRKCVTFFFFLFFVEKFTKKGKKVDSIVKKVYNLMG